MAMSKFLLSDRDFESIKSQIRNTTRTLEIMKIDNDDYGVFEHDGNHVYERGNYTKTELRVLWQMLTI